MTAARTSVGSRATAAPRRARPGGHVGPRPVPASCDRAARLHPGRPGHRHRIRPGRFAGARSRERAGGGREARGVDRAHCDMPSSCRSSHQGAMARRHIDLSVDVPVLRCSPWSGRRPRSVGPGAGDLAAGVAQARQQHADAGFLVAGGDHDRDPPETVAAGTVSVSLQLGNRSWTAHGEPAGEPAEDTHSDRDRHVGPSAEVEVPHLRHNQQFRMQRGRDGPSLTHRVRRSVTQPAGRYAGSEVRG